MRKRVVKAKNEVSAISEADPNTFKVKDIDESAMQLNIPVFGTVNSDQVLHDSANAQFEDSPDRKAAFNNTIQGFKLDHESSEEDIANIPAHLMPYNRTRIDKKKKLLVTWSD